MSLKRDDTDLRCVEVSAVAQAPMPAELEPRMLRNRGSRQQLEQANGGEETLRISSSDQAHEDLLTSVLLKKDEYRPLETSLHCMENPEFLDIRGAVVNWFATVSTSYGFVNETVVAALSHFDRYVSLTVTPIRDHMLLQLAAYVALLVASKMTETCPLRMKTLANLTGGMFTPLQVKRVEMDMISKLSFRLAPPSADETLHCLSALLHNGSSCHRDATAISTATAAATAAAPSPSSSHLQRPVPLADVVSVGSHYLKKARARTCWLRHSPYTLAVAALATAYNSLGLRALRRRLLRESDARARVVTGRGVDIHGVAACADAMANDERASAAIAAAATRRQARGSTDSPVCGGSDGDNVPKEGWGSPTGVAQGAAELLQTAAFAVGSTRSMGGDVTRSRAKASVGGRGRGRGRGTPLVVEEYSPPRSFSPCRPVPIKVANSVVMVDNSSRQLVRVSCSTGAVVGAAVTAPNKKARLSRSPRDVAAPPAGMVVRRVPVPTSPLDVERIEPRSMATSVSGSGAEHRRISVTCRMYPTLAEAPPIQESCTAGQKRRLHQSIGSCFVPCGRRRPMEGKVGRRLLDIGAGVG